MTFVKIVARYVLTPTEANEEPKTLKFRKALGAATTCAVLSARRRKPRQNTELVVCPQQQCAAYVVDNVGREMRGYCCFDAEPPEQPTADQRDQPVQDQGPADQ